MNPNTFNLLIRLTQSPTKIEFSHIDFDTPWTDDEWLINLLFLDLTRMYRYVLLETDINITIIAHPMIFKLIISNDDFNIKRMSIEDFTIESFKTTLNSLITLLNQQMYLEYGLNGNMMKLSQKIIENTVKPHDHELALDYFTTRKLFDEQELFARLKKTSSDGFSIHHFMCNFFFAIRLCIKHPTIEFKKAIIEKVNFNINDANLNEYYISRLESYLKIVENLKTMKSIHIANL